MRLSAQRLKEMFSFSMEWYNPFLKTLQWSASSGEVWLLKVFYVVFVVVLAYIPPLNPVEINRGHTIVRGATNPMHMPLFKIANYPRQNNLSAP